MKNIAYRSILILLLLLSREAVMAGEGFPNKYEKFFGIAELAYNDFSYQRALKYYQKAYAIEPTQEATLQMAECYRKLQDSKSAIFWYEEALKQGELPTEVRLNYGMVLASAGRYDEASVLMKDHIADFNWTKEKLDGFNNLSIFYRFQEAFDIEESGINSSASDFAPALLNDGVAFVSSRASGGPFSPRYSWDNSNYLEIFQSLNDEEPARMSKRINTRYHEGPAVFYDNDSKLIFTRNHLASKNERIPGDGMNRLRLFYTEKKRNGKWKKPVPLDFQDEDHSYGHPAMSVDGQTLYFVSDLNEGNGTDIFKTEWQDGKWQQPVNLGTAINTVRDELFPAVTGDKLYFASTGHKGLGGMDIFESSIDDLVSPPLNLGFPLNTESDDFGLVLKENGRDGYFSSNRDGGTGGDDIYEVKMYNYLIRIKLIDSLSQDELPGNLSVVHSRYADTLDFNSTSVVNLEAMRGEKLQVIASAEGYRPATLAVDTKAFAKEMLEKTFTISLNKKPTFDKGYEIYNNGVLDQLVLLGESTVLKTDPGKAIIPGLNAVESIFSITYGFDGYLLSEEARSALDQLSDLLKTDDQIEVALHAHTDVRGTALYNMKLSGMRAESAKKYLVQKGVDAARISIYAHGEEAPVENCRRDCGEHQHQRNRRTEFKILTGQ